MTELATSPRAKMNGKPVFTVPAKTIINFKSGFKEKLLCDGPTFSSGTACVYGCSFCYVPAAMRKQQPWLAEHGVDGKHEDIVIRRENPAELMRQQLTNTKGQSKFNDPNDRRVIYASPLVDVAGNMELVAETVDICKEILWFTNWKIRLLSKSNLLPKVAQALDKWSANTALLMMNEVKDRVIYGVSTGTLDDNLAKVFEQGTPLVSKRVESIRWLQDNGYRTFAMVCPSLPQKNYRKFADDMAAALRYDKMEHVWAECINARGESFQRTYDALYQGGFIDEANALAVVSQNKDVWETYARATFEAHAAVVPVGKLRFLQYTTKDTHDWWLRREAQGAVLL